MELKRGDVFLVNLEPVVGSEQGRVRPVIIIQNNISNQFSPLTIVAPITSKIYEKEYPTNVFLSKKNSKLKVDLTVLLNQIRTIDKSRIIKKLSRLDPHTIEKVDMAIKVSLDLF